MSWGRHRSAPFCVETEVQGGGARIFSPMNSDSAPAFVPYTHTRYAPADMQARADEFYMMLNSRRTCRDYSPEPVPLALIEQAIRAAGTAPSGAHKQPWRFVVVQDPQVKAQIRDAAEAEEKENYTHRFTPAWLADLAPLGTDWQKEFLTTAPYLIVVFKLDYEKDGDAIKKHYYVNESVGIATGMLLAALHHMGLATLTHTPSPMNFLQRILGRPTNEKPVVLVPVGYPATDAKVPNLQRKPLAEIMQLV